MSQQVSLEEFLTRNRIEQLVWEKGAIDWNVLQKIAEDHQNQLDRLRDSAELFARVIQRYTGVHSVRWRIKETDHLLEKIIRKRAEGQEKYKAISPENYFEIVTDLVGLRALHLLKDDCFAIDEQLKVTWTPIESPTAYVREGDPQDLTDRFRERGFEVKRHPAGYRSIHYVFLTQPLQRKVFAEVQVRTIFEEGWSEIDHRVRYPNFSDVQLVSYFLTIFNRLAGSADEMGTFVQELTNALRISNTQLYEATRQKEEALSKMDEVLNDIETMKRQDADTKNKVTELQQEVIKLRKLSLVNVNRNSLASVDGLDSHKPLAHLGKTTLMSEVLKLLSASIISDAQQKAIDEASSKNALAKVLKDKK